MDTTGDRASSTIVRWFKEATKAKEEAEAIEYVTTKMGNCRWVPAVDPRKCFELLQSISTKLIPPVPRQGVAEVVD